MNHYDDYQRLVDMGPATSVDELINRIQAERMPIDRMRFFINENNRERRCFGIYFDTDSSQWIVYKNKADGTRAIRLKTTDEAAAAQEIWAKILSEIKLRLDQGQHPNWHAGTPSISRSHPAPVNKAAAGTRLEDRVRDMAQTLRFTDDVITVEALKSLVQRRYDPRGVLFNENRRIPGRLGIYRDGSRWIVYKNAESGQPETLYDGPRESEAVRVLRAWIVAQDQCADSLSKRSREDAAFEAQRQRSRESHDAFGAFIVIVLIFFLLFVASITSRNGTRNGSRSRSGYSSSDRWSDWDDDDWDDDWDSSDTDWDSDW